MMSSPRNILSTLATACAATVLAAAPTIDDLAARSLPLEESASQAFGHTPATVIFADSVSWTSLAATGFHDRCREAAVAQDGRGRQGFDLGAATYQKIGRDAVAWGHASFTTAKRIDVSWADCVDYQLVAPFTLGDSVGGDLSSRRYSFGGGYAKTFGPWILGAEAAYRAEIAYRDRDPRVKDIVSSLDIGLSAGRRLSSRYVAAFSAAINVYDQSCDLTFENPINDISTYPLIGMGTYYRRFIGNDNKSSGYKSLGFTARMFFAPIDRQGLRAGAGMSKRGVDQRLRSYNNLTLGSVDHIDIDFGAAWRQRIGRSVVIEPAVALDYHRRDATENLFGTSQGASYDKIGQRDCYRRTVVDARATIPVEIAIADNHLTFSADGGFNSDVEKGFYPDQRLSVDHWEFGATANFQLRAGHRHLLVSEIGVHKALASAIEENLAATDSPRSLRQSVERGFDFRSASPTTFAANVSLSRPIAYFIATLAVGYEATVSANLPTRHQATLSIIINI